jgi:predicted small lipoprotein YifL
MHHPIRIAFIVTFATLALSACGSKGPLVLTPEQKQEAERKAAEKQKQSQPTPPPLESDKSPNAEGGQRPQ